MNINENLELVFQAMSKEVFFTSQSRLNFNIDTLLSMGVRRAYATPFSINNETLDDPRIIFEWLEALKEKADSAYKKGLEVYPFFVTINHPEGNFKIPSRYRIQQNIDGSLRPDFICFRDKTRQAEMISFVQKAVGLGFERLMFDDDLRDAFCYCDEHLYGFEDFKGKSRSEIEQILNSVLTQPECEQLRKNWYDYKYQGMVDYAERIEKVVHTVNPKCQIGICTSAKRCQDFSGRDPGEWITHFSTTQAPAFVRLCGECYDDSMWHLCQSTGWSQYTDNCYPEDVEKVIEVTSVPAINYRSPGAVMFEAGLLVVATANSMIHWAWPEEFERTGLCETISDSKSYLSSISETITAKPQSPLCMYADSNLGPYTPINISIPYGATHDPINAYNIISLLGIPVTIKPEIPENQPAVLCSSYISRGMTANIDKYIANGGFGILDAKAAQCYKVYGGRANFDITGPETLNRYEILPSGEKCEIIADCPSDSVYYINAENSEYNSEAFDINDKSAGYTMAVWTHGKGKLAVLGYDLSRTKQVLLCSQWRRRMLDLLNFAKIEMPVYWQGPIGVQLFCCGDRIAVTNYNLNGVEGEVLKNSKRLKLELENLSFKML